MEKHAKAIMSALERRDLIDARYNLFDDSRRDTKNLDDQHVISGTIECIGESVVDGITSPLFYYSLLALQGLLFNRIINTLDSMIGYNDNYYKDIGWMSATLDTIGNYIPARITAFLMVIVARILGADSEQSMQILKRDQNKTMSRTLAIQWPRWPAPLRESLKKLVTIP